MAKMSQTVKEIIQVVVFLLVVGLLVTTFLVYPLNRTAAIMGRPDEAVINPDSLLPNDPTLFVEAGFRVDTFRVEADGLTNLACLHLSKADSSAIDDTLATAGTAVLLHDERLDRSSMVPLASALLGAGFDLFVYDQRGSGLSTGQYHSPGDYEADDLQEFISYLGIRDQIKHPFVAIGQSVGADAAILAALEEPRLDMVVAIDPYLSSDRWLDRLKVEHDTYWLPFSNTVLWFWFELRSGYAAPYRELADIQPVACRTLLTAAEAELASPEIVKLIELSGTDKLTTATLPADNDQLIHQILEFVGN